jgi:septal ring factor EnvC (AmiA/AmiB activator)
MSRYTMVLVLIALAMASGASAQATRDLRDSRLRLDSIRQERQRLEREMESLKSRVRDASREVTVTARQRAASAAALQEIDLQVSLLDAETQQTHLELELTQQRIGDRSTALRNRLRSIYKRGPLHSTRVLLTAENFGDLLSRYKYLHLITLHDRRVLTDVSRLRSELAVQQERLEQSQQQLTNLREEKNRELAQLRRIEGENQRALAQYRQAESKAAVQLDAAAKAENSLNAVIARLERERREEEERLRASGGTAADGAITTRDLGSLNWPVEGRLIYGFGPVRKPSGVTLINKGIGIAAAAGSAVKAVEAGTVSLARPLEGYGSTVMLNHGSGYYTLYSFLNAIGVREGQRVVVGQVIGAVGGEQTPEGAHLFFQVRAPVQGDVPEAVDPLTWLRARAGR